MLRITQDELRPLSDVEQEFDRLVARPFSDELGAIARRHDNPESNTFHRDAFWESVRLFAEHGLTALGIPEEYGGDGSDSRIYAIATRQFCRADAGIGLSVGATKSLFIDPILIFGTEEQKQRWVVPFVEGALIGCYCQTEPNAGSDVAGKKAKAVEQPDGSFLLSGEYTFITNGSEANAGLVMAATNPDAASPAGKFTMFIVDFDAAKEAGSLSVEGNFSKLGLHHSPTTILRFDDCAVSPTDILGELHGGWKVAMQLLTDSRATAIAMQGQGIMESVREELVEYAENRAMFGKNLEQFRRTRAQRLRLAARCEALFWLTMLSSTAKDKAKEAGLVDSRVYELEASASKLLSGEWTIQAAIDGFELFGGMGYMLETRMSGLLADSFIVRTYEGAKAVQGTIVIKGLFARIRAAYPEFDQAVMQGQNPFAEGEKLSEIAGTWPLSVLEMDDADNVTLRARFLHLFGEAVLDPDFGALALMQDGRDQAMVWHLLAYAYATLMACEVGVIAGLSDAYQASLHNDAVAALQSVENELGLMADPAYRAVLSGENDELY